MLTKVEMGTGRVTLQVLAWAAFIALPVSQQGAEAAGRWEQQQEEPSREQASHQHGTRASWVGSQTSLTLSSAVALGPGKTLVSRDTEAP